MNQPDSLVLLRLNVLVLRGRRTAAAKPGPMHGVRFPAAHMRGYIDDLAAVIGGNGRVSRTPVSDSRQLSAGDGR